MKIVIRTLLFHLFCIIVFATIYSFFSREFGSLDDDFFHNKNINKNKKNKFIDFLLLSTTIQAGVGISEMFPSSQNTKIVMIVQQLFMISTHVFTIYFFTL
jgi:hypothetical protein